MTPAPSSIFGLKPLTGQKPPAPSKVRALLRAQHDELRQILLEADRVAKSVEEGHPSQVGPMTAAALLISSALAAHMEAEEGLALPYLRDADSWGPVRAGWMLEEHEAQRAAIGALMRMEERGDAAELARGLRGFIRTLLDDMRREEDELFGERVLRDDVVSLDQSDG